MTQPYVDFTPEIKDQLRDSFRQLDTELTSSEISEIIDLGLHAGNSAIASLHDVAERAINGHVAQYVAQTALNVLRQYIMIVQRDLALAALAKGEIGVFVDIGSEERDPN